ncbi:cysteine-rich KTR domain-containing protein [Johnsonella ignava]|uniref:cysteine-rich KTR domain-containing protein n=1 Tax=Johnsonella ignava TaxID=43995 RepID=UPI003AB94DF1
MPAKKQISKENILEAAIDIIRQNGVNALNARNIAEKLKCSTQPIYLSFSGMDELKISVFQEAIKIYQKFISEEMSRSEYPPYKSYGMSYVHFAKKEKELFQFLFMCDRSKEKDREFNEMLFLLMDNNKMDYKTASKIHMEMWLFGHGIATMLATSYINLDDETISNYMSDVYQGVRYLYNTKQEEIQNYENINSKWINCPVCGNKTNNKLRKDTVLKNFPIFCPKCKNESLIDASNLFIKIK